VTSLSPILTTLTIAAGLALGIERTLELLKHFMDQSKGIVTLGELIKKASSAVAEVQQYLRSPTTATLPEGLSEPPDPEEDPPVTTAPQTIQSLDANPTERFPAPPIEVLPVTETTLQQASKTLFLQLFAAGLGVLLAHYFKIKLLTVFLIGLKYQPTPYLEGLDILLSGLIIAGGSQPLHVLIRFLTERKISATEESVAAGKAEATITPVADTIVASTFKVEVKEASSQPWAWYDLDYRGGINPDSLETVHKRSDDPNLIVYHHTAMSSNAPFKDVVSEFLVSKKWLTGYHCVIMPDGKVEPFCRWDRNGNHAKGHNDRSLGISFHGNFHTSLNDRYSNADGRYGNQLPTEAQLHAGARIVALWIFLYKNIELDFNKQILPHKKVMPEGYTVCPGSNFPDKTFKDLVSGYYAAWNESPDAQAKISAFSQRKYVYK
jgi:hypothetical protein